MAHTLVTSNGFVCCRCCAKVIKSGCFLTMQLAMCQPGSKCDAREIMQHHQLVLHHASGSPAPGSDRFRYLIMKKGLGVWLDTDVILIKAIPKHERLGLHNPSRHVFAV